MARRHAVLMIVLCTFAASAFAALTLPPNITAEAAGPHGAVVTYSAGADGSGDDENGRPIDKATCAPASGSTFPLGTTPVNCTGSSGATGSFTVTVVDTRGPALQLPRDFTVPGTTSQGATVTYAASANDLVDGSVAVTCSPASGTFFAVGTTTVNCSSSDSRQNASQGSFAVTVTAPQDPPPPPPPLPDITAEATGPNGAVVTFNTGGPGDQDDENGRPLGTCAPASGSIFPLGTTTVNCTNGSFTVTVVDTRGPALQLPRDFTVPGTTAEGATVTYAASANDLVDGSVAVTCSPASGTFFAVGTTVVHCSSTDSRQNASQGSFAVTVTAPHEPPPPLPDITAEATGPNGAVVTFNTGGPGDQDDENGRPIGTCAPASGSTFPLGETSVTCSNGTFKVKVVDTTAPALFLPADITTQNATVTYTATATDLVDGSVGVTCTPPSGSTFAVGTTTVHCSATDAHSNSAAGTFNVTVQEAPPPPDTEAPTITSLAATPDVLTPPNGKLVTVQITASVHDNVDASPFVGVYDVTASEAITGDDWNIVGPLTVELRASRNSQNTGRVYTVHVEAIDAAGNRSVSSVTVTVPHDQGNEEPATAQPAKKWQSIRDKG